MLLTVDLCSVDQCSLNIFLVLIMLICFKMLNNKEIYILNVFGNTTLAYIKIKLAANSAQSFLSE